MGESKKKVKRKARKIFIEGDYKKMRVNGWYDGEGTYLWIGHEPSGNFVDTLSAGKLYRLAKNIVKEFERCWDEQE